MVKDETGNVYGYLTVLERGGKTSGGKAKWKCQCKCGKIIEVCGTDLRNGHTKSCGCYQREQTSKNSFKDITGQTIGNFLVTGYEHGTDSRKTIRWICTCKLCGRTGLSLLKENLKRQYSCGCTISSKGERKISELLTQNNIGFIQEKRFSDLKFIDTNNVARFDFYLPDYNTLIEYDGIQHFVAGAGNFDNLEKFKKTQEHDKIKNEYAKKHNINLIRIPYTHYNNIELKDLLPNTSEFLL